MLDGRPDGRAPLVLLHGLTFDRVMWRPALDVLGQIDPRRQVLALELPGHGGSAAWPRHSMAAVIATVYAARYPAR